MPSSLQSEIKKRGPFASLEQEAALVILRTSDLLGNRLNRLLREFKLTPSQYNVLRILRGEGKPMPCLEVADRMIQVAPAITRVVDQLLKLDLIEKTQCPEDRRVFHINLKPAGTKLLKKIDKPLLELHEQMLMGVSHDDLKALIQTLDQARESIANI